jgi:hypothetical protein
MKLEDTIATAIRNFSFAGYGLDEVDDADEEWVDCLAADILAALKVKPHLLSTFGRDYGEIRETSYENSYDDTDFYYVWTKHPWVSDEPAEDL